MQKKYVFTELVKDSDNPEQLLAYAFYKREKQQLASELSSQGQSDDEIDTALKFKHDNTVNSTATLNAYRDQATALLNTVIKEGKKPLQLEFDSYKTKEAERLTKEGKKLQSQWLKKVDLQRIDDSNSKIILIWHNIWKTLFSGVKKYVAGLIVATFFAYTNIDSIKDFFLSPPNEKTEKTAK